MSSTRTWIRALLSAFTQKRLNRERVRTVRLGVESLSERIVPAGVLWHWTGDGANALASNPAN